MSEEQKPVSGGGTVRGYYVEARLARAPVFGGPPQVGEHKWVTESWTRIEYDHTHPTFGVKNDIHSPLAVSDGMLTHAAAKALMAWVGSHHDSLEFRLVKVEMKYNFTVMELGVGESERFGMWVERDLEFSDRTPDGENES